MGTILVAAGVNGAGKSTFVGEWHQSQGGAYFNPDLRTRDWIAAGISPEEANARSWQEGCKALTQAIDSDSNFAFETTLGGSTITSELLRALALGREVILIFVGLDSPDRHIARVRARVERGGHDIPQAKIRERFVASHRNLLKFIGTRATIMVYDNCDEDEDGRPLPVRVLSIVGNVVRYPQSKEELARTPAWAKPVVRLALERCVRPDLL